MVLVNRTQWPNLASRSLGLVCRRLSQDWQQAYGHPIAAVESFVDSQLFRGTAYKATGWKLLGQTDGFGRVAEDFYTRHDRPKQHWVKSLESQHHFGAEEGHDILLPVVAAFPNPFPPEVRAEVRAELVPENRLEVVA
ncbi:MAG: hypothetical protein WCL11_27715, partial [Verrucomicrobiota bacterium]